jgi:dipeptidyl aminopeptidase/acylaminoacyl peptidase
MPRIDFRSLTRRILRLVPIVAAALALGACSTGGATAGPTIPHPDDPAKQVEYFVEQPAGDGPWPTIVFLHGHQDGRRPGARDFVDWGVLRQMAARGYLAIAVSQPGYGHSSGPADFSGPSTQHAVSAVIATLRAEGRASPDRLLIEGISRGALTAALVAADDASIAGLVLISGVYDLPTYVADAGATAGQRAVVAAMIAETGGTSDALQARSVLHRAADIRADTLILNGAKDDRTDPDQALALADRITRAGGTARTIVYPDHGHRIPVDVRNRDIDPFVDRVLRHAGG